MKSRAETVPGGVEGLIAIVKTWHDSSVVLVAQSSPKLNPGASPSSKVTKTAVVPLW